MYTRATPSRQIAADVMDIACQYGEAIQECAYKQNILSYLDEHGTAETLDGWIATVREYPHSSSLWTMAFIWAHPYLRELFPADVVDEFLELAVTTARGAALVGYIASASGANLPPQVQVEVLKYRALWESFSDSHVSHYVDMI